MKILHINTVYTEKNGITNVIFNLILSAKNENVRQDLLSINIPDIIYEEKINTAGGKIFVAQRSSKSPFKYISRLKKIIKSEKYDVVHIHGNSHTTVLELLAAKMAGCKVRIVHSHNTTCKNKFLHRIFTPLFTCICTHGFACGEAAGKWLFGKNGKFTVINNGVDTSKFTFDKSKRAELRGKYNIPENTVVIGHVGGFNEQKNHSFLVSSFTEFLKLNGNSRLILVGTGGLMNNIRSECERLGISDKVIFVGATDNVPDYLSAMDCFVLTSLYEGLPLSAIEAQTSGLPCLLSSNVTVEVDKTGNVVFLPISDPVVWSEHFAGINVITNTEREAKCADATEKIKACGYDINTEVTKLYDFYASVLKAPLSAT